jgi:flagellar motor switch protein FliN/FliY
VSANESTAAAPPVEGAAGAARAGESPSLEMLLDVTMPVVIEIGRASLTVQEVLQLGPGSVLPLDRVVGEPVDVYVSDRRLAQGEVVVIGDHFGVRITRVLPAPGAEAAA